MDEYNRSGLGSNDNVEITFTVENDDSEHGYKIQNSFQSIKGSMEKDDPDRGNKILDSYQSIMQSMKYGLHDMSKISPFGIYMAPRPLRDLSPGSFSPRVVSIGPLHRKEKNVQEFEKHKMMYLNRLMGRSGLPLEEILKSCLDKAYKSLDIIKKRYVWENTDYNDEDIANMMVVDACFIIEFIYRFSEPYDYQSFTGDLWLPKTVVYDLVLLENQIPLIFLIDIYECTRPIKGGHELPFIEFILPVLNDLSIFKEHKQFNNISITTSPHILGLLHQYYKPPTGDIIHSAYISSEIHSATDLSKTGVEFKPNQNTKWAMGMDVESVHRFSFFSWCWSKPTLRMPVLHINDFTELVLRNLIVYEHQSSQTANYVISYAYAMSMLVKTQDDVAMLVNSRVLVNSTGTNEQVVDMINNVCKEVTLENFFYYDEWRTLRRYWEGWIAWLKRTYFTSPWSVISLLGGVVLFFLSVIQTIFTIHPAGSDD